MIQASQPRKEISAGSVQGELDEGSAAAAMSTMRHPMNLKRQRVSGYDRSFVNVIIKKSQLTQTGTISEADVTETDNKDPKESRDERLPTSGFEHSFSICNETLGKRQR